MRLKTRSFLTRFWVILILIPGIFTAGCTSTGSHGNEDVPQPAAVPTPAGTSSSPVITATTPPAASPGAGVGAPVVTAHLLHGVTVAYPADWEWENVSGASVRDYGRTTINIANFFSPDITPERALQGQPNVDDSRYTTMSIDLDPEEVDDFEQYFNLAALALQKQYRDFRITKHNYQLRMSVTNSFSGYKAYQLDFDTKTMRGSYIFTDVDGTIYVFAVKNPSPYSAEIKEMIGSVKIEPQKVETKHR